MASNKFLSPAAAAAVTTAVLANTSLSAAKDASVAVGRAAKAAVPAALKGATARATFEFAANAAIDAVTAFRAAALDVYMHVDSTNVADAACYADATFAAEAAFTSLAVAISDFYHVGVVAVAISDFYNVGCAARPGSNSATVRAKFAAANKATVNAVLYANSAANHARARKHARASKQKVQPKVLPTKKKSSVFLGKQPRIHDVTQNCATKNAKMNYGVIKKTSCISSKGHSSFASCVPRFK